MVRVLYIYRNGRMGYSIGRVFKTVELWMRSRADVASVELPVPRYSLAGMCRNVAAALRAVRAFPDAIVHLTGTEHYLLPFLPRNRTVVTVHDIGSALEGLQGLRLAAKRLLWLRTLRLARIVTFISPAACDETLALVALSAERICVIPNAVGVGFVPRPRKLNFLTPIILQLGTKVNKNLVNTACALRGFPCRLRIVGRLDAQQLAALRANDITYDNVCDLSDEQIEEEYYGCDVVNFPSLYEGFGMPIIEGQRTGRPVVTSRREPMLSVSGEAAVLVDPESPASIRAGYESLAQMGDKVVAQGFRNAERYTVEAVGEAYLQLYLRMSGVS